MSLTYNTEPRNRSLQCHLPLTVEELRILSLKKHKNKKQHYNLLNMTTQSRFTTRHNLGRMGRIRVLIPVLNTYKVLDSDILTD